MPRQNKKYKYNGPVIEKRPALLYFQKSRQEGKLSFLIMDEVDWITGAYLKKIEDAVRLLVKELHPEKLILFGGCQIEVLSMDYNMLTKELSEESETTVCFHKGCHFAGYDPCATE